MIYTYVVAHFWPWFFIGGCVFLAAVIGFTVWYIVSEPVDDEWDDDWQHAPIDLPGPAVVTRAPLTAPSEGRAGGLGYDEWEALDPDQAADQLIAELHTDLPGPFTGAAGNEPGQLRAGGLHHSQERTVPADVWDEWWAGLDGLDREMILIRHAREREERLWAELVAETREMCAA